MKSGQLFCSLSIITILVVLTVVTDAKAVPAFARRYKLSCSTCHAPFPRLKKYGDDFAGAGFILKEEEKDRDYVTAGDDLLRLNKDFPIAARFDAYAMHDEDQNVENDLQIPWGLKLMSGGTLYKNIGYYFYFYMSERGEVAGIEDAYIHFDNIFGIPLDVMVGQFQTSDPLMKRELRLTFEDYMIYKQHFGLSHTNLAYDRGIMLVYGIERTGTDIVAMLVNGNGKTQADEDTKKFDQDKYKNFGVRISQAIGDFLSIGGFYYQGKEEVNNTDDYSDLPYNWTNDLTYIGPDINIGIGPLELTGQYLIRKDSHADVTDQQTEATGMVLELTYAPKLDKSRFYWTALYNKIDHDYDLYDYETATIGGTYLLARNLRLSAEITRDMLREKNRFVLGMVSGF